MAAKSASEETSERKRVSIPKADESVLQWWQEQRDPALSIRMLIRAEIERSGYTDIVYKPVSQQARRGRPPGSPSDFDAEPQDTSRATVTAITAVPVAPTPIAPPAPAREPERGPVAVAAGSSAIDAIMNG